MWVKRDELEARLPSCVRHAPEGWVPGNVVSRCGTLGVRDIPTHPQADTQQREFAGFDTGECVALPSEFWLKKKFRKFRG